MPRALLLGRHPGSPVRSSCEHRADHPDRPAAPDADWDTVRGRIVATLVAEAVPGWTDHNAADPGITLAEAAAFTLADLHHRIATTGLADWPLAWSAWEPGVNATGSTPCQRVNRPGSPLATALAATADVLEPLVRSLRQPG